jgi:hypothetical protein
LIAAAVAGDSGPRPAPAAAQTPALTTVVILTAGIDPSQLNPASCPPVSNSAGC